uniref:Uncharacterized protein n=1 Tax=Thermosporothrix sp. COM3 TaxID=2490863 RepID=A0A455SE25_9CHLR|nr:hypothetical protein KTC_14580 [Thermosporothrix sp. COM3]
MAIRLTFQFVIENCKDAYSSYPWKETIGHFSLEIGLVNFSLLVRYKTAIEADSRIQVEQKSQKIPTKCSQT